MKHSVLILTIFISLNSFSQEINKEAFIEKVYTDCANNFSGDLLLSAKSYPLGIHPWNLESLFEELDSLPKSVVQELKHEAFQDTLIGSWECANFKNIKCVNVDTFQNGLHPRYYKFSRPLFDKEKKYALITMGYNCGILCAYRCTYVYKYQDRQWLLLKKIDCWVS
jgi:hypothetical protein